MLLQVTKHGNDSLHIHPKAFAEHDKQKKRRFSL